MKNRAKKSESALLREAEAAERKAKALREHLNAALLPQPKCAHRKTKWANEKKGLVECVKCGARQFIGDRRWVPKYSVGAAGEGK